MTGPTQSSAGVYRIPYANSTAVEVTEDHRSHSPPGQIDLNGLGDPPLRLVAAAAGIVRRVVDGFSENRPGQEDCNNNYVWIEHPNGEWTKYSHMRKGSVRGTARLEEGDPVRSGQLLGIESDVGCAHGTHLHFEVGVPQDPTEPVDDDGDLRGSNRIPRICLVAGRRFIRGARLVAAPCPPVDAVTAPVDFGPVEIGTSRSLHCRIVNVIDQDVTVRVPASAGGSAFAWTPRTATLGPGADIDVPILFTPTRLLPDQATLVVSSDRGVPLRVGIGGMGRPAGSDDPPPAPVLRLEPPTLGLGSVHLGRSGTGRIRIVNPSRTRSIGVSVDASPAGGPIRWPALSVLLPAGRDVRLEVTFTPRARGTVSATVSVAALPDGGVFRVAVSGQGVGEQVP